MNIPQLVSSFLLLAPLLLASALAEASIVLALNPVVQTGNTVDVALQISGLGEGTAPSLGSFDVDVTFETDDLAYAGTIFGDPVLGDQLDVLRLGGNPAAATGSAGAVNIFELSLDTPGDLDDLQARSFILAILSFNIVKPVSSSLGLTVNVLGDADGDSLAATATGTTIAPVPLPGALLLMGSGLAGLATAGSRRRNPGAA